MKKKTPIKKPVNEIAKKSTYKISTKESFKVEDLTIDQLNKALALLPGNPKIFFTEELTSPEWTPMSMADTSTKSDHCVDQCSSNPVKTDESNISSGELFASMECQVSFVRKSISDLVEKISPFLKTTSIKEGELDPSSSNSLFLFKEEDSILTTSIKRVGYELQEIVKTIQGISNAVQ